MFHKHRKSDSALLVLSELTKIKTALGDFVGVGGERRRGSKVRRGSWAKGESEERRAGIRAYRARTSEGLVVDVQ